MLADEADTDVYPKVDLESQRARGQEAEGIAPRNQSIWPKEEKTRR